MLGSDLKTSTGVRVVVADDYAQMSRLAADIVTEVIAGNPGKAITLPTGGTPRGMYEVLTERINDGSLDFYSVEFFCMDDYLGKSIDDDTSLTAWLNGAFLKPANLSGPTIHFVPTMADDPDAAAQRYDAQIQGLGGFELAVLGIGNNGHIGFNEPGSPIDAETRVVDLTIESRDQNAAYYEDGSQIPDKAMTVGVKRFLEARRIVLIVSGAGKAEIVAKALEGPISSDVPGSYLQTAKDRLTVILDEAAAANLTLS